MNSGRFIHRSWHRTGARIAVPSVKLVPLSRFESDFTSFSDDSFRLCIDKDGKFNDGNDLFDLSLVEEDDLPDLCRFIVAAFGAEAIRVSQDMNEFEKMLVSPAAALWNGYSGLVAFAEVFSGTKQRLASRLEKLDISVPKVDGLSGREAIEAAEKDSLILVLARSSQDGDPRIQVIASIELRLQVRKRKISRLSRDPRYTYCSVALRRENTVQFTVA